MTTQLSPTSQTLKSAYPWTSMFVFDLALGIDPLQEILDRHEIDAYTWQALQENLAFRREVILARKEVTESGTSFKRKAALHAERYLIEMDALIHDPTTPPNVKHDIFKTLAKLGELEPKDQTKTGGGGSDTPQFAIQINIG